MRRLVLAFLVVLFCSAFQSTGFSGCGGGSPPPADLPPGDEVGCFSDLECASPDGCRMMACVSGTCADLGARDDDLDGAPSIACGGTDCDDLDGSRYPGAFEYCDGRDQDCDDVVDEDAAPTPQGWYLASSDLEVSLAAYGPGLLAAARDSDGTSITVQVLDRFGTPVTSARAFDGEAVGAHDLVQRNPDTVTVVALLTDRPAIVLVDIGSDFMLRDEVEVPTTADARSVAAIDYPGGIALTWIEGTDVRFWTSELAAPVTLGTLEAGTVDLAFDGDDAVVSLPPTDALFVDPSTGTVTTTRTLEARTWADQPLASDDRGVFVLMRDAFDHAISPFDAVSGIGTLPAPPVADRSLPGRIDVRDEQVLVTRFSDGTTSISGVTLSILNRELVPLTTFDAGTLGSLGSTAYDWDVAIHERFVSIVTAYDGNAYGVTLTCGL